MSNSIDESWMQHDPLLLLFVRSLGKEDLEELIERNEGLSLQDPDPEVRAIAKEIEMAARLQLLVQEVASE